MCFLKDHSAPLHQHCTGEKVSTPHYLTHCKPVSSHAAATGHFLLVASSGWTVRTDLTLNWSAVILISQKRVKSFLLPSVWGTLPLLPWNSSSRWLAVAVLHWALLPTVGLSVCLPVCSICVHICASVSKGEPCGSGFFKSFLLILLKSLKLRFAGHRHLELKVMVYCWVSFLPWMHC